MQRQATIWVKRGLTYHEAIERIGKEKIAQTNKVLQAEFFELDISNLNKVPSEPHQSSWAIKTFPMLGTESSGMAPSFKPLVSEQNEELISNGVEINSSLAKELRTYWRAISAARAAFYSKVYG